MTTCLVQKDGLDADDGNN